MQRIVLILWFSIFSSSVMADWELLGSSVDGDKFYINHLTVKVDGANITMWVATDYASLQLTHNNTVYKSSKSQFEYHCDLQTYTLKNVTLYSKNILDKGQSISSTDIPDSEPKPAKVNSLNAIILKELCQQYLSFKP